MANNARTTRMAAKSRQVENTNEVEAKKDASVIPKEIDPNQYVTVRNGFQGRLIYKSKRTDELYIWESFGQEQEIELRELKAAKNNNKEFFINNWFMFDEDWIIDYLGVNQFYKYAIDINNFDEVFEMKPDELRERLRKLSKGQKKSVAYRAMILIKEQKIDSLRVIGILEEELGVELVER